MPCFLVKVNYLLSITFLGTSYQLDTSSHSTIPCSSLGIHLQAVLYLSSHLKIITESRKWCAITNKLLGSKNFNQRAKLHLTKAIHSLQPQGIMLYKFACHWFNNISIWSKCSLKLPIIKDRYRVEPVCHNTFLGTLSIIFYLLPSLWSHTIKKTTLFSSHECMQGHVHQLQNW